MGNCLIIQGKKEIKIMRLDGKILSYQSPLKVHQALSDFPGYGISKALPAVRHLNPKTNMLGGKLYYLIPLVKLHNENGCSSNVPQIKMVLRKQELKDMLEKGVSVQGMVSHFKKEQSKIDLSDTKRCMVWKPTLETIPEGNNFF